MFTLLLANLVPIYVSIAIGYMAGKLLKIDATSISTLLFYVIAPIMMFSGPTRIAFVPYIITLPLLVAVISSLCCAITYYTTWGVWGAKDGNRSIAAVCGGATNGGYVGLPLAMAIFDQDTVAIYIIAMFGIALYENTYALFLIARNNETLRASLRRVIRMPTLYAFVLGCFLSYISWDIPDAMAEYIHNIRGCYAIMGILQIGLGLAAVKHIIVDWKFISVTFVSKFLLFPVLTMAFIAIDHFCLHHLPHQAHDVLLLMSVMPVAANTLSISLLFRLHPDKVASIVTLSIIFAGLYVPLAASLLLGLAS